MHLSSILSFMPNVVNTHVHVTLSFLKIYIFNKFPLEPYLAVTEAAEFRAVSWIIVRVLILTFFLFMSSSNADIVVDLKRFFGQCPRGSILTGGLGPNNVALMSDSLSSTTLW